MFQHANEFKKKHHIVEIIVTAYDLCEFNELCYAIKLVTS